MGKIAWDAVFSRPAVKPVWLIGGAQAALQGAIAPSASNPSSTTANTDYTFAWSAGQVVNHVAIQNNSSAAINFDLDATASAGSFTLAAGATIFFDIQIQAVHLFTSSATNVNGTAAGNVVIRGWL